MELGFEIGDKVKMVDSRYLRESIGVVGEVILIKDIDNDGDIEVIIKPDNPQGERLYYVGNWGDVLEKVEEEVQGECHMLNLIFEELGVVDKEAWDGNDGEVYRLTKEGCLEKLIQGAGWLESMTSYKKLLSGELKPIWEPKKGKVYYMPDILYPFSEHNWSSTIWDNHDIDKYRLGLNMVFKTEEEAIKRSEEIIEILKGNK